MSVPTLVSWVALHLRILDTAWIWIIRCQSPRGGFRVPVCQIFNRLYHFLFTKGIHPWTEPLRCGFGTPRPTVLPLSFGLFSIILVKTMGYLSPYLEWKREIGYLSVLAHFMPNPQLFSTTFYPPSRFIISSFRAITPIRGETNAVSLNTVGEMEIAIRYA